MATSLPSRYRLLYTEPDQEFRERVGSYLTGFGFDLTSVGTAAEARVLLQLHRFDLVLLDLDHPNWLPLNDPVNQLVHCEDGTAVVGVMIGGRMVVENRRVLTVDLAALRERAAAARDRLAAANADNRLLYEALVPVVGSYCPGLAASPYHIHRYGARLQ